MRLFKTYAFRLTMIVMLSLVILSSCNSGPNDSGDALSGDNGPSPGIAGTEIVPEITITRDEDRLYETMDYIFISDDSVIGEWEAVDFVQYIDDFDPKKPVHSADQLYYVSNSFYADGTVVLGSTGTTRTEIWTKGYICELSRSVVPAYAIKTIDGTDYLFVEWKSGDYTIRGQTPQYYVFEKISDTPATVKIFPYDDVRWMNLSNADMSELNADVSALTFNDKTIWPAEFLSGLEITPEEVLEAGKNPGLGVRSLHERGLTGSGVSVAIIDQPLYYDGHPEYSGKIAQYKDFGCETETSMHGPSVASLLVGEEAGTAPGAKMYYAAVPSWKGDATYYADALDWIISVNEGLPENEKIRVVSVSAAPSDGNLFSNGSKWTESVNRATKAGILVLDCTSEFGILSACSYDPAHPEDVSLCTPGYIGYDWRGMPSKLLVPINYRTTAEENANEDYSYQYCGVGGLSWGIPYCVGVLAMGWEVRPDLTSDEMIEILFDTAYKDAAGNNYINPTAFIEFLEK